MSKKEEISVGLVITGFFGMLINATYEIISNHWWVQIILICLSGLSVLIGYAIFPKEENKESEELKEISDWEKCYLETLRSKDPVSEVLEKFE